MYSLYTDKPTDFACEVSVKNASLKDAFARIVVESNGFSLLFEGAIKDGKCVVPIRRLKGLLDESTRGKMKLEVVVEDTYFTPWSDDFLVEANTAVKVHVNEQKKPTKPLVEIKSVKNGPKISNAATDLLFICERVGINKTNLSHRKNDFKQVVKEYFKANPEHLNKSTQFISETVNALR